jgi:outer membrane lipase/esterase
MIHRYLRATLGAALTAWLATPASAQTPPDVLDDLWVAVCAQAGAGTAFRARCDEILDAGPGGAGRRSSAAIGNNLGVASAQARASAMAARIATESVDRRLDEVKEDEPGGGGSFEWAAGRLSVFLSGDFGRADREQSDFETGYEADSYGGTVGADYRFGDRLVTGLALSFAKSESDYDANAGDLDTDSLTATAYASYSATENLYFDAYLGHGWLDYDGGRTVAFALNTGVVVNGAAAGDTDGRQWIAGARAGYDFFRGALTVGPYAKLDYSSTDIDGFTETSATGLALTFQDQDIRSLQSALGAQASYALSYSWGVLLPAARAEWVHEFDDDRRTITASFAGDPTATPIAIQTDSPDRDFFRVGLSLSAVLPGGVSPFADYEHRLGHRFLDEQKFSVGVRFEF